MLGGCSVWPASEAWFYLQDSPCTLQLAASGGTWLWGDAGPGPTQALALACLSPWILLTLLEFHFQVSSDLVNLLATHFISLSPSLWLTLRVHCGPEGGRPGCQSCGRECHTVWGGLWHLPTPWHPTDPVPFLWCLWPRPAAHSLWLGKYVMLWVSGLCSVLICESLRVNV